MNKLLPSCQDFIFCCLFTFPLRNKNEIHSAAIFIMCYFLTLELLGLEKEESISVSYTIWGDHQHSTGSLPGTEGRKKIECFGCFGVCAAYTILLFIHYSIA